MKIRKAYPLYKNKIELSANAKTKENLVLKVEKGLKLTNFIDNKDSRNLLTVFEKMINKLSEDEIKILFSLFKEMKL